MEPYAQVIASSNLALPPLAVGASAFPGSPRSGTCGTNNDNLIYAVVSGTGLLAIFGAAVACRDGRNMYIQVLGERAIECQGRGNVSQDNESLDPLTMTLLTMRASAVWKMGSGVRLWLASTNCFARLMSQLSCMDLGTIAGSEWRQAKLGRAHYMYFGDGGYGTKPRGSTGRPVDLCNGAGQGGRAGR